MLATFQVQTLEETVSLWNEYTEKGFCLKLTSFPFYPNQPFHSKN